MGASILRSSIAVIALIAPLVSAGCTLLAPSDEELMGGLSKVSDGGEAGKDGEAGDASRDANTVDANCGASGATCSGGGDCCSGKCKGNKICM